MNSKDLRALEHVERLVGIGVDALKIEGRTKSAYYAARTAQVYRRAIDDAVAGRPFDPRLLGELEGLANLGYTDGFYQRHHASEMQNYLRGHSESGRSRYVGDVVGWDSSRGLAEVEVKNRFAVGDRIEVIHPSGNWNSRSGAWKTRTARRSPSRRAVAIGYGSACRGAGNWPAHSSRDSFDRRNEKLLRQGIRIP